MKFGMNMLLWTADPGEEHFPIFSRLREAGFDGVELTIAPRSTDHRTLLRRELDQTGLECTAIFSPAPDANPVSPDPAVRARAVEGLREAVGAAFELGSPIVGGPIHSAYGVFTGEPATDDERSWSAECLRAAAEEAEQAGITLALEHLNRFECYLVSTVADALDLIQRVDHPNLRLHYDTHHAHIEERDTGAVIAACGDVLAHVHVSENDRGVPGRGQVAWGETFAALRRANYDSWLTIEAFSRHDPDFASAIHVWRDFAPADEIFREGHDFMRREWARVST